MKKLLNLNGAQQLSKNKQQSILGGIDTPCGGGPFQHLAHITNSQKCVFYGASWLGGNCYACL